jgi:hypothetical protein
MVARDEGLNMAGGARRWLTAIILGFSVAAATDVFARTPSAANHARPEMAGGFSNRDLRRSFPGEKMHTAGATGDASGGRSITSVSSELDQPRRDGHLSAEERRLLRQHIEDAARELYKR